MSACFGNYLDPDYLVHLENLETQFNNLGYKQTPKLHAIFTHIANFLVDKKHGLGVWSEHAFEGVHWDFNEHLKNYNRDPSHRSTRINSPERL